MQSSVRDSVLSILSLTNDASYANNWRGISVCEAPVAITIDCWRLNTESRGKNDKRSELVGLNHLISQLLKFTLRPKKVKFKKLWFTWKRKTVLAESPEVLYFQTRLWRKSRYAWTFHTTVRKKWTKEVRIQRNCCATSLELSKDNLVLGGTKTVESIEGALWSA